MPIQKVRIMNRRQANEFTRTYHGQPVAMISISTPGQEYDHWPVQSESVPDICRVDFHDIDRHDSYYPDQNLAAISARTANKIAKFILKQSELGRSEIIIHCDAGQSRSAGVAAAIADAYELPSIFDDPRYTPNMRVYRFVRTQLARESRERRQET